MRDLPSLSTSQAAQIVVPCNVAFSWNGLPQYAARLIRAAIKRLGKECVVVGSRPGVPVKGMEEVLGQTVHWVDARKPIAWGELGLNPPDIFIQSGWSYPAFSALGREVKKVGGHVIGLSDANWRGDFRQLVLGPIAFRLLHRRQFDAMLVPGQQGARLMQLFGMPRERTRHGMYGADPAIFGSGPPLSNRPKTFLFVGQFIPRKDVLRLASAFLRFSKLRPGWTLRICGIEQHGYKNLNPGCSKYSSLGSQVTDYLMICAGFGSTCGSGSTF